MGSLFLEKHGGRGTTFEPSQGSVIKERTAVACRHPTACARGGDQCHVSVFPTCRPHHVLARKGPQQRAVGLSWARNYPVGVRKEHDNRVDTIGHLWRETGEKANKLEQMRKKDLAEEVGSRVGGELRSKSQAGPNSLFHR